jgi:hypothetical protein
MLFDALDLGSSGVLAKPQRGIFDNMKTAVDKIGRGKARQVNARFAALASHYLFETDFCNPASGWEKGQVEKNVQDARHRLWHPMPSFPDLAALNDWPRSNASRNGQKSSTARCPAPSPMCTREEVASLMPMGQPFDSFIEQIARVAHLPHCLRA